MPNSELLKQLAAQVPAGRRRTTKTFKVLSLEQRQQIVHEVTVNFRMQKDVAREFKVSALEVFRLLKKC